METPLPRLTLGVLTRLADAIEHVPEALAVWDPDDVLITCNRQYACLFPEPSFVRPGVRFRQLVDLNIETRNVQSFATVRDVNGSPAAYRRVRHRAHSAAEGSNTMQLGDGRWLQVSERQTDAGDVVGIYTDVTTARSTDVAIWLSLALSPEIYPRRRSISVALGPRQEDVLRCVQEGLRNRAIADRLGLAEQTVKNHVSRLIRQFGARHRGHLVWLTRPGRKY